MDFNSQDSQEIMKNFKSIVGSRLEKLYNEKGSDGELYAYSIAVSNQKKKKAKEETMEDTRLREMVINALTEKSKPKARPDYPDIDKDGDREESMKKAAQDKKKMQMEDLDLGHTDDEPHMLKADLYRIGKYAMELYKMVDQFEGEQEVDFPHWWQSKIVQAKSMLVSAKHYLDFETKEPQIDAMVDVASEEGAIGEEMTPEKSEKIGMPFKGIAKEGEIDEMSKKQIKKRGKVFDALKDQGMPDKKAGPIATSVAMKEEIKKAILAKLKEK